MSLRQDLERIARKEGFRNASEFVNNFISSGGSFQGLKRYLEGKNIWASNYQVWDIARPLLTIPYDYRDAYDYKYNAIAREKGFSNAKEMFKKTLEEAGKRNFGRTTYVARKLGMTKRACITAMDRYGLGWERRRDPYDRRYSIDKGGRSRKLQRQQIHSDLQREMALRFPVPHADKDEENREEGRGNRNGNVDEGESAW